MTYTAKWKVIQAKTINYIQVDDVSMPCLDLVDTLGSEVRFLVINFSSYMELTGVIMTNNIS